MKKIEDGYSKNGLFFDGTAFYSTCDECQHEQGDVGGNVTCEECGSGPMPSADTDSDFIYDDDTETWFLKELET